MEVKNELSNTVNAVALKEATQTSFRVVRHISDGRFGKVYLINILNNGQSTDDYRILKQNILESPLIPYEVVRESTIANEVRNNPLICAASHVFLGDKYMFLFMEYLNGTLVDVVDELAVILDPKQFDKAEEEAQFAQKESIEQHAHQEEEEEESEYSEEESESETESQAQEEKEEEVKNEEEPLTPDDVESNTHEEEENEDLDDSNASSHLSQIDTLFFASGTTVTLTHDAFQNGTFTTLLHNFEHNVGEKDESFTPEQLKTMENDRLEDLRKSMYDKYNIITRSSRNAQIKQINKLGYKKFWLDMTKQLLQIMNELEQYGYMHDDFRLGNVGFRLLEDNSIQLVVIDYSQIKRLSNHYDAANRVPDFPTAPPEIFTREPIVNQAFDTRAVGYCSGALLDPLNAFFSNYNDELYEIQETEEEEEPEPMQESEEEKEDVSEAEPMQEIVAQMLENVNNKIESMKDEPKTEGLTAGELVSEKIQKIAHLIVETVNNETESMKAHQKEKSFTADEIVTETIQNIINEVVKLEPNRANDSKAITTAVLEYLGENKCDAEEQGSVESSDSEYFPDAWAQLTEPNLRWFWDTSEKYGLIMRINKENGNNWEDDEQEAAEMQSEHENDDESKLVESVERVIAAKKEGKEESDEDLLNNYDEDKYLYVEPDPSNLHEFAAHIQKRRSYTKMLDYSLLVWWLQFFIRDPSKRPSVQTLLAQLQNPSALKITKPKASTSVELGGKKRKAIQREPLFEIPTESWNLSQYSQQNPSNWKYANIHRDTISVHLTTIQHKAMKKGLEEMFATVQNDFVDHPLIVRVPNNLQFLTLVNELYCSVAAKANALNSNSAMELKMQEEEECVNVFKACFLMADRWFCIYNRQVSMNEEEKVKFQRFMFKVLVQLGGKIDRMDSWYNQLLACVHRVYAEKNNLPILIQNKEILDAQNLYERSITFFEVFYNTALFLLWTCCKIPNAENIINFNEIAEHAFSESVILCSDDSDKKSAFTQLQRQLICYNFPENASLTESYTM
jgi:hypothetical protein